MGSFGFETQYARPFDRPTELENGPEGLTDWLDMFGDSLVAPIPVDERSAVVSAIETLRREDLYQDGTWIADYRRLRIVASTPH